MSLWLCPKHGLYGGQVFCPMCGKNGEYVTFNPPVKQSGWEKVEWPIGPLDT